MLRRDPVEIVATTIIYLTEAAVVVLFIGMVAVWAVIGSMP